MLRCAPDRRSYIETHWLDRRQRKGTTNKSPAKKPVSTTDPPGAEPGPVPQPAYSRIHPPATHPSVLKATNPLTLFPDDIPGVFPQVQELPPALWHNFYSSLDPILMLKRMALNHIYVPSVDDGEGNRRWNARFDKVGLTVGNRETVGAVASTVSGPGRELSRFKF